MNLLKNHPFAIEAFFESSTVLTFSVPKEQLINLIPNCLNLDTYKDELAFIAVAMVHTKNLRPKGFPKIFGNTFFLIGYRIFVRYTNKKGKSLRGLYILKSETNKKKMELLGNIFTHYNYTSSDIVEYNEGNEKTIISNKSNIKVVIDVKKNDIELPINSPFINWKDARKFAGPLPNTFTILNNNILIIEGIRQNWKPTPIEVKSYNFEYLNSLKLKNIELANAFEVKNIPYSWKKGRIENWI